MLWGLFALAIGGIHFLNVQAAVGHLGMAGLAGSARILVVPGVAGEATEAFVNTDGGAIVAGAELRAPVIGRRDCSGLRLARRVALIAKGGRGSGLIVTRRAPSCNCGNHQRRRGKMHAFAAVEEGERIVEAGSATEMRLRGVISRRPG